MIGGTRRSTGRRAGLAAAVALAVAAAVLGGCGPATSQGAAATPVVRLSAVSWLIPPAEVTGLVAAAAAESPATIPLPASALAKNATEAGFATRLTGWGYLGGWQRTFQGESRHLTLVVSRSLLFGDHRGASAFASYMLAHMAAFYPNALITATTIRGERAWILAPPMCGCHMASPLLAGLIASGDQVAWLEINGPDATPALLSRLLDGRSSS